MKPLFETLRSIFLWTLAFPVFVLSCLAILLTALFTRGRARNRSAVSLTADPDRPGKGGIREMNRLQ